MNTFNAVLEINNANALKKSKPRFLTVNFLLILEVTVEKVVVESMKIHVSQLPLLLFLSRLLMSVDSCTYPQ